MKMTLIATAGLLSALMPTAAQAAPKPSVPPTRILVTLQAVEVPSRVVQDAALKPYPAQGAYDALLKQSSEASEMTIQTSNDFPGVARYNQFSAITTQISGKSVTSYILAPTSLEATPHINGDGTVTVDLNMEVTRFAPRVAGTLPATITQSMTTRRTFKSGQTQTLPFGGTASATLGVKPGASPETKVLLEFMRVTVLPGAVAAR